MKVIDPGHRYELDWLDGKPEQFYYFDGASHIVGQNELLFVKREGAKYLGNIGHHPGTTMQEVLRALIDRAKYVNNQIPCEETSRIIECMIYALYWLEKRAARCHYREYNATMEELISGEGKCMKCGHVGCDGKH